MSPWQIILACVASGAWGAAVATWRSRYAREAAKVDAARRVGLAQLEQHERGEENLDDLREMQLWYRHKLRDVLKALDSGSRRQVERRCHVRLGLGEAATTLYVDDEPKVKS